MKSCPLRSRERSRFPPLPPAPRLRLPGNWKNSREKEEKSGKSHRPLCSSPRTGAAPHRGRLRSLRGRVGAEGIPCMEPPGWGRAHGWLCTRVSVCGGPPVSLRCQRPVLRIRVHVWMQAGGCVGVRRGVCVHVYACACSVHVCACVCMLCACVCSVRVSVLCAYALCVCACICMLCACVCVRAYVCCVHALCTRVYALRARVCMLSACVYIPHACAYGCRGAGGHRQGRCSHRSDRGCNLSV